MKQYTFFEGAIGPSYRYSFSPSIFNLPAHLDLQAKNGWRSFFILDEPEKMVHALIHFHIEEDKAISPRRATYGGLEFNTEMPGEVLFNFISFFDKNLKAEGITHVHITASPEIYNHRSAEVSSFLLHHEYAIRRSDVSAAIPVKTKTLKEILHRSEKRRLEKAHTAGLTFRTIGLDELPAIYKFIKACREKKGFDLSMSLGSLQETITAFKDNFFLFAVHDNERIAAASIAIKIKENVLYEFYHDHDADYDHLSPVVMLVSGIYDFCLEKNIGLFDLGTSTSKDAPNFPLLHFKLLLGAQPSPKFTFEKTFER